MSPSFDNFYNQILDEESKARASIENAKQEKVREQVRLRELAKKEVADYEIELKNDLLKQKAKVDESKIVLQKAEEDEVKEIEKIKELAEERKQTIIDFILSHVTEVDLTLPDVVKGRVMKKKK